jgi:hypothetical protein
MLSIHSSLDMVAEAGPRLLGEVATLAAVLRDVLSIREPTRAVAVCIVLAQMLSVCPGFGTALIPHFWQLGTNLNVFYRLHRRVDLGYNSRKTCSLHECVEVVLQLMLRDCGLSGLQTIRRFVPLFSASAECKRV